MVKKYEYKREYLHSIRLKNTHTYAICKNYKNTFNVFLIKLKPNYHWFYKSN